MGSEALERPGTRQARLDRSEHARRGSNPTGMNARGDAGEDDRDDPDGCGRPGFAGRDAGRGDRDSQHTKDAVALSLAEWLRAALAEGGGDG